MNRQLSIKIFVTLLIGVVTALVLGGSSVQAQTTTTAPAGTVDSSITLAAKGSLTDAAGSVTITGNVIVDCRRVIDTTNAATPALVLLDLDFSQVQGTSGSLKNQRVFVTGGNRASEIRPLQAADTVVVTVPYYDSTKDVLSAKSMLATVTLNFDTAKGTVTSGSVTIGNNVVTADAVGTTSTTTPQ